MYDKLKPPTDSLWKFLMISSLIGFIFLFYFTQKQLFFIINHSNEVEKEVNIYKIRQLDYSHQNNFAKALMNEVTKKATCEEDAEIDECINLKLNGDNSGLLEILERQTNKAYEMKKAVSLLEKETQFKINKYNMQVHYFTVLSFFIFIGIIICINFFILGFRNWIKMQNIQDDILFTQYEKIQKELGILRKNTEDGIIQKTGVFT